ncbi:hypothetical protein MSEO_19450 [Mycobacterium seoulense]|uniref:Epoxide hydrolase N-terminal domain-containing protein n=1 Tax=Mycobacterium seoulense TaxID=386911 RepID=A0A7I7NXN8_9MYCO|nr:hypothetical protein MSEO_19450 [Mycobacterium seoulense]
MWQSQWRERATLMPFRIDVCDDVLEDLRSRLRRTRWPEAECVDDWSQGMPLAYTRDLAGYWADEYDWRSSEAALFACAELSKTCPDSSRLQARLRVSVGVTPHESTCLEGSTMAKNINLTGKIAVVTGAGSGIGAATARLLARHGAKVHVADINADAAAAVAGEIGGGAVDHAIDVSHPEEVEALAKAVFDQDGRVDILHNNAGIGHGADIDATTVEDWQRVIGVNLLGVAYGVQAFVPRMLEQGHPATVINTASEAGLHPIARMAPYCASKFGVVGMSEALNAELRPRGIRVVALCPGIINTPIVREGTMRGDLSTEQAKIAAFYDKHGASPDTVAAAVLDAIARPRLIVATPRTHVLAPYVLHRISPRLVQPLARVLPKVMTRG